MADERVFYKCDDANDNQMYTQLVFFPVTPDTSESQHPGIYLQTHTLVGGYDSTWVILNKSQAEDLATQLMYHAQFLEDEDGTT